MWALRTVQKDTLCGALSFAQQTCYEIELNTEQTKPNKKEMEKQAPPPTHSKTCTNEQHVEPSVKIQHAYF